MRTDKLTRTINLESLVLDVDRLSAASRAAASISEGLRALENSGLRQCLRAFEEKQAAVASALKPFEDLQHVGRFLAESPVMRDMQRTSDLIAGWDSRFRLPEIAEIGQLLSDAQTSSWSDVITAAMPETSRLQDALKEMTKPWLSMQESMRSIAGLAELHGIGRMLGDTPGFDERTAGALRLGLGDWRDLISWRPEVLEDRHLRAGFYTDLGFNHDLTAFPAEAFDEGLDVSGVRGERPALLVRYEHPVARGADDDEAGFARTNKAHDWLLRLETQLRAFIDRQMTHAMGADWVKSRLPNGMYDRWQDKKQRAREAGADDRPLIAYADFTDYTEVICRRDNWREVFAAFFGRPESVRESFQRLYPIRLDTMHARVITQDDELLLYVEARRLMKMAAGD
jgi:hypothetical protein